MSDDQTRADDDHEAEKLAKAGSNIDTDEGAA